MIRPFSAAIAAPHSCHGSSFTVLQNAALFGQERSRRRRGRRLRRPLNEWPPSPKKARLLLPPPIFFLHSSASLSEEEEEKKRFHNSHNFGHQWFPFLPSCPLYQKKTFKFFVEVIGGKETSTSSTNGGDDVPICAYSWKEEVVCTT